MALGGDGVLVLAALAVLASACGSQSNTSSTNGNASAGEESSAGATSQVASGGDESRGGAASSHAGGGGTAAESEAGASASCKTPLGSVSVSGTIRGARVDAAIRDGAFAAVFLGPGASATSEYSQSFDGTNDAGGNATSQFTFGAPTDVVSASLEGWAGVTAAQVGIYPSTSCGYFVFEMSFPIPSGVVCSASFAPCDEQCEPSGELALCVPGHPKVRYSTRAVGCAADQPAVGGWQLELTSVCPHQVVGTLIDFETHGHLSATLVNEADASDNVTMNLDF